MGTITSKAKMMAIAIENYDMDEMKILMKDLTNEQKHDMCKSLVPGNENKCSIIHYAVWQDSEELLELLLDYVDDLEIRDGLGWTPLMTAVNRGSLENVKLLLKHGAKVDCDYLQGMNLIATAMGYNNIELVDILMDHGAQVTYTSDSYKKHENPTGCYLLHFAADSGLVDIARLLIKKGKIPINTVNQTGWSPLHLAVQRNYLNIVKLLLENGANINIKDHYGNTPLAWAKQINAKDVIEELERHGGIADKQWHGEHLGFIRIEDNQFEIEDSIENKSLNIPDALQRQR